ncbi:alkaline phosphatase family protein [Rarobacter incanus]|uniref:Type I phosphodiesterase/nucleotide pyrophosphatase n=1 Tax=Rarobacter incanus TaxID=153494 RepID=A0A542SMH6_9MICO|nr:nucleotide pyrophosphatase/phosphodiesterase family protein [Rarobacter incanus]TQK75836.1 type I phosphodiesterase/nucleotide pyrophosphatase [Rarobacter incanus]
MTLPGRASALGMVWPGVDPQAIDVVPPVSGGVTGVLESLDLGSGNSRVCVVLVDGLGRLNIDERSGHVPTLRSGIAAGRTVQAPYPSTTAASIAAFGTGCAPGQTGMLGYTVREPVTGVLGNLVQWTGLPAPEIWQPRQPIFGRLVAQGVAVTSIGPERFRDSGMTRASLRGGAYVGAEDWYQRIDAAARALRKPGLAYVYWGDLDKAGHHYGWNSSKWSAELEKVDAGIRRLLASVPTDTTVIVTADHGMIDIDRAQRWDASTEPGLAEDVVTTAGEPRALHVHVAHGADSAAVAHRWQDVLGDSALVMVREEAVAAGLFGEVDQAMIPRMGDVIVAMAGRATVVDSRSQTPASMELIGVHGSMTPHEMLVPVLRWDK